MGSRKFHGGMFAVAVKSHKLVGPGGLGVGMVRAWGAECLTVACLGRLWASVLWGDLRRGRL